MMVQSENPQTQISASFPEADASGIPSLQNTPSHDAVTEKNATHNASHPSKRPKIDGASPENEHASQQDQIARPDPRSVKGRRGHLQQMAEMPLDTLHEIFRELEPVDLLHLSWASKSLNAILMEKSSRYIWEEAFERLYGSDNPPPRCPPDLNFAQYARFLFEKKCQVCGVANGYWCSWMMRLRVCWSCLCDSGKFVVCGETSRNASDVLVIHAKKVTFRLAGEYSSTEIMSLEQKWKLKSARTKQTEAFEKWESNRSNDWKEDLGQRRAERKTAIIKKLKGIGWGESDIKIVVDSCTASAIPGFMRAKKLTNSDWTDLQPKLVERLRKLREEELAQKRRAKLSDRWLAFWHQVYRWRRNQTMESLRLPDMVDLAVREPFKNIIFTPSLEDGDFSIDEIDRVAKEWMEYRDNYVLSLLPTEVRAAFADEIGPSEMGAPLPKLLLASFLFTGGGSYCLNTIDKVYENRADIYDRGRTPVDDELRNNLVEVGIRKRPWVWDCYDLEFHSPFHEIAKDVIILFGMDPQTATVSEMAQRGQMFECLTCDDDSPECERVKLDWSSVVSHDFLHQKKGETGGSLSERWRRLTI